MLEHSVAIADGKADPEAAVFWPAVKPQPIALSFLKELAAYAKTAAFPGKRAIAYVATDDGRYLRVTVEELQAAEPTRATSDG